MLNFHFSRLSSNTHFVILLLIIFGESNGYEFVTLESFFEVPCGENIKFDNETAVLLETQTRSAISCYAACSENALCMGVNIREGLGSVDTQCELLTVDTASCSETTSSLGWVYSKRVVMTTEQDKDSSDCDVDLRQPTQCTFKYRLLYEYDPSGDSVYGSMKCVLDAVSIGAVIRVAVEDDDGVKIYWSAERSGFDMASETLHVESGRMMIYDPNNPQEVKADYFVIDYNSSVKRYVLKKATNSYESLDFENDGRYIAVFAHIGKSYDQPVFSTDGVFPPAFTSNLDAALDNAQPFQIQVKRENITEMFKPDLMVSDPSPSSRASAYNLNKFYVYPDGLNSGGNLGWTGLTATAGTLDTNAGYSLYSHQSMGFQSSMTPAQEHQTWWFADRCWAPVREVDRMGSTVGSFDLSYLKTRLSEGAWVRVSFDLNGQTVTYEPEVVQCGTGSCSANLASTVALDTLDPFVRASTNGVDIPLLSLRSSKNIHIWNDRSAGTTVPVISRSIWYAEHMFTGVAYTATWSNGQLFASDDTNLRTSIAAGDRPILRFKLDTYPDLYYFKVARTHVTEEAVELHTEILHADLFNDEELNSCSELDLSRYVFKTDSNELRGYSWKYSQLNNCGLDINYTYESVEIYTQT